jgi:hypothetical protein
MKRDGAVHGANAVSQSPTDRGWQGHGVKNQMTSSVHAVKSLTNGREITAAARIVQKRVSRRVELCANLPPLLPSSSRPNTKRPTVVRNDEHMDQIQQWVL